MWICKLCSHETKKRANLIRHLKLVHNANDREGRNATKRSTTIVELCRTEQMHTSESSNDHKLQSIMMNARRSITGEGCHEKIHPEKRHQKYGMCKQQPMIEPDNFEESSGYEPKSDQDDRQYTTRTN